jgi:hypothetical protein
MDIFGKNDFFTSKKNYTVLLSDVFSFVFFLLVIYQAQ